MTFVSILDKEESSYKDQRRLDYLQDLNVDQLIERIQFQWLEDITPYYRYFPENECCEQYRRDVLKDVKRESIQTALLNYVNQMREMKKASDNKAEVNVEMQAQVWYLWEMYHYCTGVENLYGELQQCQPSSEGLRSLMDYLDEYIRQDSFAQISQIAKELIGQLQQFCLVIQMENNKITISQEPLEGEYEKFLKECFPGHKGRLRSPFADALDLSCLETELMKVFRKKNADYFRKLDRFCSKYVGQKDEVLMRFYQEIGYYLAYVRFEDTMKEEGFAFATPQTDGSEEMYAVGLYDLALACVNYRHGKPVVSNDMVFHEGEEFFVVTGPNQGGKTTFARSLGQLVYFAKMGLDVPATAANVPYFADILTHFSVEESIETGKGKLKEELDRLAPMMAGIFENSFVIINELFTTAANYDACIMGKRVMEHFQRQKCKGVYVTHLKELTEGDHIVSLRALVDVVEENHKIHNIRRFKIQRCEAEDTGYAGDLIEKYRLSYDQIVERLKGRGNC